MTGRGRLVTLRGVVQAVDALAPRLGGARRVAPFAITLILDRRWPGFEAVVDVMGSVREAGLRTARRAYQRTPPMLRRRLATPSAAPLFINGAAEPTLRLLRLGGLGPPAVPRPSPHLDLDHAQGLGDQTIDAQALICAAASRGVGPVRVEAYLVSLRLAEAEAVRLNSGGRLEKR